MGGATVNISAASPVATDILKVLVQYSVNSNQSTSYGSFQSDQVSQIQQLDIYLSHDKAPIFSPSWTGQVCVLSLRAGSPGT